MFVGKKKNRIYSRKALNVVTKIKGKYPDGITDVKNVAEEPRAWIHEKISQLRECVKNVKFPSKPEWWELLRINRNKVSHQTEDLSDDEFSSVCSVLFGNLPQIEKDLNENIKRLRHRSKKKRKFESSASSAFGSEEERKQLVDAMEDAANPVEPSEIKIEFPDNKFAKVAENTLLEILAYQNTGNYIKSHYGLSENIQTDILQWLEKAHDTFESENPFFDEAVFIEEQKRLSAVKIAEEFVKQKFQLDRAYEKVCSKSEEKAMATGVPIEKSFLDFDFYRKKFLEEKQIAKKDDSKEVEWKSKENLVILRRNFITDMEKNLIERKNKWEMERIELLRQKFLKDLYAKIDKFTKLEKLLSPFLSNFGRLWDLSEGQFETSGFEILETFASLLEKDESLIELANLLGKQIRAQSSFEKELRDKTVIKTEYHPRPAYRGEIKGLCYSNDIPSVLPQELSLMRNKAANKLFQLKFAQKQLLSYEYQNQMAEQNSTLEKEEVAKEKEEPKGPIIICVDTSGSMGGTPENIAKTISFALSKIAIEEERKCYLISFSTGIETMDLSSLSKENPIENLVRFLRMSFNGGTDAVPALEHALKLLPTNEWKNADVLMISDFVMASLDKNLVDLIEAEKEKNTCFYSLVIGYSGNQSVIECFNHNWAYNLNDPKASRHLVEQLHEIRQHSNIP